MSYILRILPVIAQMVSIATGLFTLAFSILKAIKVFGRKQRNGSHKPFR